MSTNRFFIPLVVVALAAVTALTVREALATTASVSSLRDDANYQFRRGEIAQIAPRVDAQYEFRLGEIEQMAPRVDAQYQFRLGEIEQMAPRIDAQYEFRRGEWFGN